MLTQFENQAPELMSLREVMIMREAGILVARALKLARSLAKPGVRTDLIDREVESFFRDQIGRAHV